MNKTAENIIELFREVRQSTLKRLSAVPEGKELWRLSPDKMTIADMATHIIKSDNWLIEKIKTPEISAIDGEINAVSIKRRDDYNKLLDDLNAILDKKILCVKSLTMWDFDRLVYDDRFKRKVNIWFVIMRGNIDHEIHHRGQLSAYLHIM